MSVSFPSETNCTEVIHLFSSGLYAPLRSLAPNLSPGAKSSLRTVGSGVFAVGVVEPPRERIGGGRRTGGTGGTGDGDTGLGSGKGKGNGYGLGCG